VRLFGLAPRRFGIERVCETLEKISGTYVIVDWGFEFYALRTNAFTLIKDRCVYFEIVGFGPERAILAKMPV